MLGKFSKNVAYFDQDINIFTISQVKYQVEVKNILYFFPNIRYFAEY